MLLGVSLINVICGRVFGRECSETPLLTAREVGPYLVEKETPIAYVDAPKRR